MQDAAVQAAQLLPGRSPTHPVLPLRSHAAAADGCAVTGVQPDRPVGRLLHQAGTGGTDQPGGQPFCSHLWAGAFGDMQVLFIGLQKNPHRNPAQLHADPPPPPPRSWLPANETEGVCMMTNSADLPEAFLLVGAARCMLAPPSPAGAAPTARPLCPGPPCGMAGSGYGRVRRTPTARTMALQNRTTRPLTRRPPRLPHVSSAPPAAPCRATLRSWWGMRRTAAPTRCPRLAAT